MIQAKQRHVKVKILILVFMGYLIWVLAKGMADIGVAYRRIDGAKELLVSEQTKNEELREKLSEVQTREYLEMVARNELNMQKEGETVVVLEEDNLRSKEKGVRQKEDETKDVSNWEKWWRLVR